MIPVLRQSARPPVAGRVLVCENGVAVVSTPDGSVRATYSGRMLGRIARDRKAAAVVGDAVVLRHWPDGVITIEDVEPRDRPGAEVIDLRSR